MKSVPTMKGRFLTNTTAKNAKSLMDSLRAGYNGRVLAMGGPWNVSLLEQGSVIPPDYIENMDALSVYFDDRLVGIYEINAGTLKSARGC